MTTVFQIYRPSDCMYFTPNNQKDGNRWKPVGKFYPRANDVIHAVTLGIKNNLIDPEDYEVVESEVEIVQPYKVHHRELVKIP